MDWFLKILGFYIILSFAFPLSRFWFISPLVETSPSPFGISEGEP
jgi:hypothetical protein